MAACRAVGVRGQVDGLLDDDPLLGVEILEKRHSVVGDAVIVEGDGDRL